MNNGKVRIYELSKELNLDNKDILEICTQLEIAVKSHSSTINESQVERIRSAAKNYVANPVAEKGHRASSGKVSTGKKVSPKADRSKDKSHKQQILAIHKHNRSRSITDNQPLNKSSAPILAAPPRPPIQSPVTPSVSTTWSENAGTTTGCPLTPSMKSLPLSSSE